MELYKSNRKYRFHDDECGIEGEIVMETINSGRDIYTQVSHIEFDDEENDDAYNQAHYTALFEDMIVAVLRLQEEDN
jgi:hypothetical protein